MRFFVVRAVVIAGVFSLKSEYYNERRRFIKIALEVQSRKSHSKMCIYSVFFFF